MVLDAIISCCCIGLFVCLFVCLFVFSLLVIVRSPRMSVTVNWFLSYLLIILHGYGFLSRGFTDRREILHGGSATSQTGLLLFWVDSPRDGRVMGVNRGHVAGYAFCWSTCLFVVQINTLQTIRLGQYAHFYDRKEHLAFTIAAAMPRLHAKYIFEIILKLFQSFISRATTSETEIKLF